MKQNASKHITVLLVDDHTVVREGLRMILQLESDIQVVAEARSGREAVQLAEQFHPDVIVMDIAMPLMNGFEATRQILKSIPGARILILSAHSDDEYVNQMMTLGVAGYLIKQNSARMLAAAIREVKKGSAFFSPEIGRRLEKKNKELLARDGALKKKNVRLSSRESEVLQLIAEGKANKEIAFELSISIKTVEKHRQHLMEKLDIHDTAGLTRYAISTGVIESSIHSTLL